MEHRADRVQAYERSASRQYTHIAVHFGTFACSPRGRIRWGLGGVGIAQQHKQNTPLLAGCSCSKPLLLLSDRPRASDGDEMHLNPSESLSNVIELLVDRYRFDFGLSFVIHIGFHWLLISTWRQSVPVAYAEPHGRDPCGSQCPCGLTAAGCPYN